MTNPMNPEAPAGNTPPDPSGESATSAARRIAQAAVAAQPPAAPTPPVEPAPAPPAGEIPPETPPEQPAVEATPGVQPEPGTQGNAPTAGAAEVAAAAAAEGVPFTDVVEALAEMGIAVVTDEVPPESYGAVDSVLRMVQQGLGPMQQELSAARVSDQEMALFRKNLEERPESILLGLAVAKPEKWQEVAQIVERMAEDPVYKELILQRLDIERRESRLAMSEERSLETRLTQMANRATAMTQAAAKRYNVDSEIAERYVAGMVSANGVENFDLNSIDGLVAQLKPKTPTPKPPAAVSPAAVAATRTAPPAPAPTSPPAAAPAPPAPTIKHLGGETRSWIRAAAARVRDSTRGG